MAAMPGLSSVRNLCGRNGTVEPPTYRHRPMEWGTGMKSRLRTLLLLAAGAALALGLTASPAQAGPSSPATAGRSVVGGTAGAAPDSSCGVSAFGYTGYAKCGTHALGCDWNGDGYFDEYFVVADNRTIWHVWPNSGRWWEMPNGGRADDTYKCYWGGGHRVVEVWVNGSGSWYSWCDSAGNWHGWYKSG